MNQSVCSVFCGFIDVNQSVYSVFCGFFEVKQSVYSAIVLCSVGLLM